MKTLVIFDSVYGNTEKVAKAIGEAIGGVVRVARVGEVIDSELNKFDLVVIGSPTEWNKPTKAIQKFLNKLPEAVITGIKTASFDTRLSNKMVGIFGYAAGKISNNLKKKGALVLSSEGFFVQGSSLKNGELERAANWAKEIVKNHK